MNGDIFKQNTKAADPAPKRTRSDKEQTRGRKSVRPVKERPYSKRRIAAKAREVLPVKIIPLGGLEQIGMNITCFEYNDSIVVVDCGIAFPESDMMGIDMVIPDVTYLRENIAKVKGLVITHGHEDHIGAMGYILKEINIPIYATKLTMGLIEHKFQEHQLMDVTERHVVRY